MSQIHHTKVFFSGRVQGVGFRYQALQVAREFDVAGFVRNLSDGRVELEAEGAGPELKAFIEAVQERMESYIRQVEQSETVRPPQFQGFAIR